MAKDVVKLLLCDFKLSTAEVARIVMLPESAVKQMCREHGLCNCPREN
jgi:hypothetical protein